MNRLTLNALYVLCIIWDFKKRWDASLQNAIRDTSA